MKPQVILQLEKELNIVINEENNFEELEGKEYAINNKGELVRLSLTECRLKNIPSALLNVSVVKSLIYLNLEHNNISNLTKLVKFKNLKVLLLGVNQIFDISPLEKLIKLSRLDLQGNIIKKLPYWICNFNMDIHWSNQLGNAITLYKNPIENVPIEIITQGKEAIKNYFAELEKGTVNLYETKLLLVGYGAVGKTSLMKRLVYDEYNENEVSTEGIDIKRWNLKTNNNNELKINIWDFGGQEIYHSTHQFFLSKRSIYLLVWDARIDKMMPNLASFDYWLRIVSLLSQNSPILVVQNKIDQRASLVAEKYLQEYFPNIVGFYKVSAKEKTGIEELKNTIF